MKLPKNFIKKFVIPIYKIDLHLSLHDDTIIARRKLKHVMSEAEKYKDNNKGYCAWDGYDTFILLLRRDTLTISTIAHEVYHLTSHIIERCRAKHDPYNHEMEAYLNGYLMQLVCDELNIKV
jgi:hypothetical protein